MNARPLSRMTRDLEHARRGGAFSAMERDAAARIIAAIRRDGDAGVLRAVRRFDRPRATTRDLVADAVDLRRAARGCPPRSIVLARSFRAACRPTPPPRS